MSDHKPGLLVSLGISPAIVPEAFLMPGVDFGSVHVLTTAKPNVAMVREFFQRRAPSVDLHIARVARFEALTSEEEHFEFEEVLYRWILATGVPLQQRYICLSGGFKTMSAAMQKAATVLGAGDVFHVLADEIPRGTDGRFGLPSTIDEVEAAFANDRLHWIRLGAEPGWPQLRDETAQDYPLDREEGVDGEAAVCAPDSGFRDRLAAVVERSQRIATSWGELPELPFVELAAWRTTDLDWLNQPLRPADPTDRSWVAGLPKIELHCHLGGFATSGPLLEGVRSSAVQPGQLPAVADLPAPADWPLPQSPIGLEAYRRLGDNNGSRLLRDSGCLSRQCELLYDHLVGQGVRYAEIRCSPANYASAGVSPWEVLKRIKDSFDAAANRCRAAGREPCQVNLLLIGTRQRAGDFRVGIARHLALAVTAAEHWKDPSQCRVVGVDLAGFEDPETRAQYFREEFVGVHRCGLALTVHAGENDDAEGVWSAVFDLNARRLGHALSLHRSPELLGSVADRGIGIEMCPYANLQIKGYRLDDDGDEYPLLTYLRKGARVTVNTDNIGISSASLTENILLAARLCPAMTRMDVLRLQRNAIETAFLPSERRNLLIRAFERDLTPP